MISGKKYKTTFVKKSEDTGHIPDEQITLVYDKIPGGGGGDIDVDDHLDKNSTNPVQNKIIAQALEDMQHEIETSVEEVENELEGI